jgi:hypothetical protein
MTERNQRLCTWSGPFFAVLFLVGFGVVSRYVPPPLPTDTAAEVAQRYRENATSIRAGMVMTLFAIMFYTPWAAAISVQLKRIEGRRSPLAYAQLGMGAALSAAFIMLLYFFIIAAFRPERSDDAIQMLNDLGWVPFTGLIYTIFVQNLIIGIAVLGDKRERPVFPRWFGYFSIWIAIAYTPACLDAFFVTGPLAWNGILSWWLSLVSFCIYIIVITTMMLRTVNPEMIAEDAAEGRSEAVPAR